MLVAGGQVARIEGLDLGVQPALEAEGKKDLGHQKERRDEDLKEVVDDAKELIDLRSGGRRFEDVRVAARINLPHITCEVDDDRVGVRLTIPIQAVRGPQLAKGEISFVLPYFVAVADARGRILGKRVFTVRITIPDGQKIWSVQESIEQNIPLPAGRSAASVVIYTGFQLTPAQLEFNRRNRLRF